MTTTRADRYIAAPTMSLDATVRRLADLEEIRDLARRYAHNVWKLDIPAVVELFTSQGCSSCPPADQVLTQIVAWRDRHQLPVYCLSFHVDYWNYIGWEDPFSSEKYSAKQSQYNRKFNSRSNYTPQLVINGKDHFVGSDAQKLYQNIGLYGSVVAENQIEINSVDREPAKILLEYKIDGSLEDKRLRAVLVIEERTTKIKRGENINRTLTNSNIAISEAKKSIDQQNGRIQIIIPDLVHPDDKLTTILIIENEDLDIVGAASCAIL